MSLGLDAQQIAFTFKGGMLPLTVIELASADIAQIETQLSGKVSQSPAFFQHTPVVIGLERLADQPLALDQLCAMLRRNHLLPVAVRGGSESIKQSAWALGIGWFPPQEGRLLPAVEPVPEAPVPDNHQAPALERYSGRIFRGTVRSGQQVSAPHGDLVVVGAVNAGAEILAAGSIHVYGALRGRALAGIHGDREASLFCHELDAELLSVAGNYKRLEDIPRALLGKSVQVRMLEDQLEISVFEP